MDSQAKESKEMNTQEGWAKSDPYKPTDAWIEGREGALAAIRDERRKQLIKWGERSYDNGTWSMIIGEEFGEVCEAMLNIKFPKPDAEHDANLAHLRMELIHLSAVTAAMVQQIDTGSA